MANTANAGTVSVAATATLVWDWTGKKLGYGVDLIADPGNSLPIYVGWSSGITAGADGGAIAVHPGKSVPIPPAAFSGGVATLYAIVASSTDLLSYQAW